jgi:hypothetical protein
MPPDLVWPDWQEEDDQDLIAAVRESVRSRTTQRRQGSATGPSSSETRPVRKAGVVREDDEDDYEHLARLMKDRGNDPPGHPNRPLATYLRDTEKPDRISSTADSDTTSTVHTEAEVGFMPMHPTWVEELVRRANSDPDDWIETPKGQTPDPNRFAD